MKAKQGKARNTKLKDHFLLGIAVISKERIRKDIR